MLKDDSSYTYVFVVSAITSTSTTYFMKAFTLLYLAMIFHAVICYSCGFVTGEFVLRQYILVLLFTSVFFSTMLKPSRMCVRLLRASYLEALSTDLWLLHWTLKVPKLGLDSSRA